MVLTLHGSVHHKAKSSKTSFPNSQLSRLSLLNTPSHFPDSHFPASITESSPHTISHLRNQILIPTASTASSPNSSKMRLLHTKSLQSEEFLDSQIPKDAILSHRWGDEEVMFQEFGKGKKRDGQGYVKIGGCCALADQRGFDWVRTDTCCIDKKSCAGFFEVISSMFRWYTKAGERDAYPSDVVWKSGDKEASAKAFGPSLWFTRRRTPHCSRNFSLLITCYFF